MPTPIRPDPVRPDPSQRAADAEAGRVDAVRAVGLVKVYGAGAAAVTALDRVTVGFEAGRFTAIMGPSGSGKSTLMHLMAGLDTATSGSVRLAGIELTRCTDAQLTAVRRDRVGFVFQAFNLFPHLTAWQNLDLPARLAGRAPDPARRDRLIDLLGPHAACVPEVVGRLHPLAAV